MKKFCVGVLMIVTLCTGVFAQTAGEMHEKLLEEIIRDREARGQKGDATAEDRKFARNALNMVVESYKKGGYNPWTKIVGQQETKNKFKPEYPMLHFKKFDEDQYLGSGLNARFFYRNSKYEEPNSGRTFADSYCEEEFHIEYEKKKFTCYGYNTYKYHNGEFNSHEAIDHWMCYYNAVIDNIEYSYEVPDFIKKLMQAEDKDFLLILDYSIEEYTQLIHFNWDKMTNEYWKRIYHVHKKS